MEDDPMLQQFKKTGADWTAELSANFPLFSGQAPDGHPSRGKATAAAAVYRACPRYPKAFVDGKSDNDTRNDITSRCAVNIMRELNDESDVPVNKHDPNWILKVASASCLLEASDISISTFYILDA